MGSTCSRLKTQLYFWRNNLLRYLSVRNTTFLVSLVVALGTVTCIFLLTMFKRQYMVSCKPLAAPDSKPLINANIKWQVSGKDGK